jgi:hypothetical protein
MANLSDFWRRLVSFEGNCLVSLPAIFIVASEPFPANSSHKQIAVYDLTVTNMPMLSANEQAGRLCLKAINYLLAAVFISADGPPDIVF